VSDVEKLRLPGIQYFRARKNDELEKTLNAAIAAEGPVLCEIMTPKDQLIIPTVSSAKRPDGTMVSKPIEDMYPFLDRKEFSENMIVHPIEE
jgi:acetolactate synthase-1/2/3 large subunit